MRDSYSVWVNVEAELGPLCSQNKFLLPGDKLPLCQQHGFLRSESNIILNNLKYIGIGVSCNFTHTMVW